MFATFKKRYHEKWNEWAINAEKEISIHGNTKSPGFALVIQWISQIWEEFDEHLIKNSFEQCRITSISNLHSSLKEIYTSNQLINEYIDLFYDYDDILGKYINIWSWK